MRQLRRWKRLWWRSMTCSHKRTSMGPSRSCWSSTTSALQLEEITSKGTRVSCVYYQQKCPYEKSLETYFMILEYSSPIIFLSCVLFYFISFSFFHKHFCYYNSMFVSLSAKTFSLFGFSFFILLSLSFFQNIFLFLSFINLFHFQPTMQFFIILFIAISFFNSFFSFFPCPVNTADCIPPKKGVLGMIQNSM